MCWKDRAGLECFDYNRRVGLDNSLVKLQPDRDKENERVESRQLVTGNR